MGKALVFGTGDNMLHAYKYINDHYEAVAFIDNNANKQGMIIDGKPVISIHDLNWFDYECIIVTPTLHQSICKQLLDYGVAREKIILLQDLVDYSQYKGTAKIAFCLQRSLTDYLVAANYIWHFAKVLLSSAGYIDIYCASGSKYAHFVFEGNELVQHIFDSPLEFVEFSDYDLVVQLNPYPVVLRRNDRFLSRLLPNAVDYVLSCERFRIDYGQLSCGNQFSHNRLTVFHEIQGYNWLRAPDASGFLGLVDDYRFPLPVLKTPVPQVLKDGKPWVTICTLSNGDVRDWPQAYWDSFRAWLIKAYADRWIMDIAGREGNEFFVNCMRCGEIVRQRLSLSELAFLLRDSKLMVGTDTPLIHLRYALHGGTSIVLFGATSEKVKGCPGNENLRGLGCKHWCEGVAECWEQRCLRGQEVPPCMESITPEWVIERVEDCLSME